MREKMTDIWFILDQSIALLFLAVLVMTVVGMVIVTVYKAFNGGFEMAVSDHAEERIRKRFGRPKKSVNRLSEKALREGVRRTKFTGTFRNYLDSYYLPYKETGSELFVYDQSVFVFAKDGTLITAWRLPRTFVKAVASKGKLITDVR